MQLTETVILELVEALTFIQKHHPLITPKLLDKRRGNLSILIELEVAFYKRSLTEAREC